MFSRQDFSPPCGLGVQEEGNWGNRQMRKTGYKMHLPISALPSSHYLNGIYVIELENGLSWKGT